MESIQSILEAVSKAAVSARKLSKNQKQIILTDLASALISNSEKIIQENKKDLDKMEDSKIDCY